MMTLSRVLATLAVIGMLAHNVASFTTLDNSQTARSITSLKAMPSPNDDRLRYVNNMEKLTKVGTSAILAGALFLGATPAFGDEIGRETEAPTLFTGETLEICVKRGPLGACTKTELRTAENDNDKADKYFREPTALVRQKDLESRLPEDNEANALIQKLKQQSEDNRDKNEKIIQQKTFMNDKSATFGPFDRQTLILNADGQGFTLLENPQAMRLKKQGFIEGRQFVKQPSQADLDAALESEPGLLDGLFGSK